MYVSKLVVRGFRSLRGVKVSFGPALNVLVGKNNSGKSNVIGALDCLLGEKWPSYRNWEDRDFFFDGQQHVDRIQIACVLKGDGLNESLVRAERGVYVRELGEQPGDGAHWAPEPRDADKLWLSGDELASRLVEAQEIRMCLQIPRDPASEETVFSLLVPLQLIQTKLWYNCSRGAAYATSWNTNIDR